MLIEHSVGIARALLDDGSLGGERTTPVSTRLEGLLSALVFLPIEQDALRQEILAAAHSEIPRLLACQVKSGTLVGAIPRDFAARAPGGQLATTGKPLADDDTARSGEIRIDYVQHALSALMAYDRLVLSAPKENS
jgi:hypothetical protein